MEKGKSKNTRYQYLSKKESDLLKDNLKGIEYAKEVQKLAKERGIEIPKNPSYYSRVLYGMNRNLTLLELISEVARNNKPIKESSENNYKKNIEALQS